MENMHGLLESPIWQKLEWTEAEDEKGQKVMHVSGVAQKANSINRNGRVYPREAFEKQLPVFNAELNRRPGAIDHPLFGDAKVLDSAILYKKVWLEGDDVKFDGDIIPTSKGKDLEQIIKSGVEVGISSRGAGSAKQGKWEGKDASIVDPKTYELFTFDVVSDPSVVDARIQAYESVTFTDGKPDGTSIAALKLQHPDLLAEFADQIKLSFMNEHKSTLDDAMKGDDSMGVVHAHHHKAGNGDVHEHDHYHYHEDEGVMHSHDHMHGHSNDTSDWFDHTHTHDHEHPTGMPITTMEPDADDESTQTEAIVRAAGRQRRRDAIMAAANTNQEELPVSTGPEAKMSTKDKDALPNSAFALVSGNDRALPHHDSDGKVDASHVRNALARINQVKGFSAEEIAKAKKHLEAHMREINPDYKADNMEQADLIVEILKECALSDAQLESIKNIVNHPKGDEEPDADDESVKKENEILESKLELANKEVSEATTKLTEANEARNTLAERLVAVEKELEETKEKLTSTVEQKIEVDKTLEEKVAKLDLYATVMEKCQSKRFAFAVMSEVLKTATNKDEVDAKIEIAEKSVVARLGGTASARGYNTPEMDSKLDREQAMQRELLLKSREKR